MVAATPTSSTTARTAPNGASVRAGGWRKINQEADGVEWGSKGEGGKWEVASQVMLDQRRIFMKSLK